MIGQLTEAQIENLLRNNILGRLGCSNGDTTYVVPVSYVYDGRHIIAHSLEGRKVDMMRKNPKVCFEVDEVEHFAQWRSVVAWGEFQELTDERDRYNAIKLFVDKMLHLKISETAIPPEIHDQRLHPRSPGNLRPVIYRIVLTEKTGRYETDE